MPARVRKYNPGFLTDDELVSSFCVHKSQLESVLETLRECTGESNPHTIVIGPRGSGKTSLLLRAAAEMRRDAELSARLFPVVFPEESYEVGSCGEFWLAALTHLADGTPRRADDPDLRLACAELRAETNDRRLEDLSLAALLDFADREGKRLVLIVENLGMLFAAMTGSHDGWRLRHTLQTEPRIVLLASAVSRFRQIDDSDEAFYGFLQPVVLPPLGTGECAALWEYVSGRPPRPEAVRPMQILTGGSPRLIAIVARFGSGLSFRELMADLLDLIDDHTDYFKSQLDALPPQERRIFLALAELWKPATAREVAARARLDTSKCSAQLRRLRERGAVRDDAGAPRRKQYYVTERLYNIYYLLRRRRGGDRIVEALIRFMSSYYSPSQLVDIGVRMASDVAETVGEMRDLHRAALERLIEAPTLKNHRDRLLASIPLEFVPPAAQSEEAFNLMRKAYKLKKFGRLSESINIYDKIIERFSSSREPEILKNLGIVFCNKADTLYDMDRFQEALIVLDEFTDRFETIKHSEWDMVFAREIIIRTEIITTTMSSNQFNRSEDALIALDKAIQRFRHSRGPVAVIMLATALYNKGFVLSRMNQMDEALSVLDEIVNLFDESDNPDVAVSVAGALFMKSTIFSRQERYEEALEIISRIIHRFEDNGNINISHVVADAYLSKSMTLSRVNRQEESLITIDKMISKFGNNTDTNIRFIIGYAYILKCSTLIETGKIEEAADNFDRTLKQFEGIEDTLPHSLAAHIPSFSQSINKLFFHIAFSQLDRGDFEAATTTATRALETERLDYENRLTAYCVCVVCHCATANRISAERDVTKMLRTLIQIESLPKLVVRALLIFSQRFGARRAVRLLETSAAAERLLPLLTALRRELGESPGVAREISEVADDIQRDFTKLKTVWSLATMTWKPDLASSRE